MACSGRKSDQLPMPCVETRIKRLAAVENVGANSTLPGILGERRGGTPKWMVFKEYCIKQLMI